MNIVHCFFKDQEIRFVDGNPVANDVAAVLGYADPAKTISTKVSKKNKGVADLVTPGGIQSVAVLKEAGIYQMKNAPQLLLYLAAIFGGEVKDDRMLLPFTLDDGKFVVHSIAPKQGITHNRYLVSISGKNWNCSCPNHQFRGVECKHIDVVRSNVMELKSEPAFLKDWQASFV